MHFSNLVRPTENYFRVCVYKQLLVLSPASVYKKPLITVQYVAFHTQKFIFSQCKIMRYAE